MNYKCSKKFKDGEIVDGFLCYHSLKSLFENLEDNSIIYLENEIYYEKVILTNQDITIIGKENSIIQYDAYHGQIRRKEHGGDGLVTYGTTGSASFTVKSVATGLKMINVTIQNAFKHRLESKHGQAVAFKTESKNGYYKNCKFEGWQDTLYIDQNDHLFENCKIEGDVDFIFGSGNCFFKDCMILIKSIDNAPAYLLAPNTYIQNKYGLCFSNCTINSIANGKIYLGREWHPKGALFEVKPRAYFKKCTFPKNLHLPFIQMHKEDVENGVLFYKDCIKNDSLISNYLDDELDLYYNDYLDRLKG